MQYKGRMTIFKIYLIMNIFYLKKHIYIQRGRMSNKLIKLS